MLDTLDNVKSRLGITGSEYDSFLTDQITLISDVIEAYCRRKFAAQQWVQTFYKEDIRDHKSLFLYHFPTISLDSVRIDGNHISQSAIRLHKPTSLIKRIDGEWFYGHEIVIKHRAGYEKIPSPILAVLDALVGERYNKRKSGVDLNFGSDVQRISIPGAISIDFDYTLTSNERTSAYGTIIGNYANVLDGWRTERAILGSGKIEYVEEDV